MRKVPIRFVKAYQRLRSVHERMFSILATGLFSLLYIVAVPLTLIVAKEKISSRILSGWQPWRLKSDTLEEVKKQY